MIEEMWLPVIPGEPGGSLPTAHDTVKLFVGDVAWYIHIRRVLSEVTRPDGVVALKVLASYERAGDDHSDKHSHS